jgi:hypothetical protein
VVNAIFFDGQEGALGYLVVSNSCDLERGGDDGLEWISVVPIYPYKAILNDILDDKVKKINDIRIREQKKGKSYDAKGALETTIADIIQKEANYKPKYTFFISPLKIFNNMPTIAFLDDIRPIDFNSAEILLKYKICSMKNPWREKLGFKVGNLFNRVSTFTPDVKDIRTWWVKAYSEEYIETLTKIPNQ